MNAAIKLDVIIRQIIQDAVSMLLLNQTVVTYLPDGLSRDNHEEAIPHYSWVHGLKYFRCHTSITCYIHKYVHAKLLKQLDQDINECIALETTIDAVLSPVYIELTGQAQEPFDIPSDIKKLKTNLYAHATQGVERWAFLRSLVDALNP